MIKKINNFGKLILVPTPLFDDIPLNQNAFTEISSALEKDQKNTLIVFEDPKISKKRWLKWGFPRNHIDTFNYLNEHNTQEFTYTLLSELKSKKNIFLMSDGGLPAFCDPGQQLIELCHREGIIVSSIPFENSVSLSIALSGFKFNRFVFEGFLPVKDKAKRKTELERILASPDMSIILDTPYRLNRLIDELTKVSANKKVKREYFLALDLGGPCENLIRGSILEVKKNINKQKCEFVLIVSPKYNVKQKKTYGK